MELANGTGLAERLGAIDDARFRSVVQLLDELVSATPSSRCSRHFGRGSASFVPSGG